MLAEVTSARERLSLLIRWTCVPQSDGDVPGYWGLWFDLWAQAFRHEEISKDRLELDGRWRNMIVDIVKAGKAAGEIGKVNARQFAVTFAALLDGLSIQVALADPEVDSDRAYTIAMGYAEHELSLPPARRRTRAPAAG
jgi:BetI-type transcriptional repressor, C-terminal